MRSEGLEPEQLAELHRRQPHAIVEEHATAEGDSFVSIDMLDRRAPRHITALAGHFVVFNGLDGEVLAQGTDFVAVLDMAGL